MIGGRWQAFEDVYEVAVRIDSMVTAAGDEGEEDSAFQPLFDLVIVTTALVLTDIYICASN